jgi:hypothetical protein
VDEGVYGDIHQFFEKLMADAGIVANGLPENQYSGFQLNQALTTLITQIRNIPLGMVVTNYNNYTLPGQYTIVGNTPSNAPLSVGSSAFRGTLFVTASDTNNVRQTVKNHLNGSEWTRYKTAGSWLSWVITKYAMTEFDIPAWNMDSTTTMDVDISSLSLNTQFNIKRVEFSISDDTLGPSFGPQYLDNHSVAGVLQCWHDPIADENTITLRRLASGTFDSTDFNGTSGPRGTLRVYYEDY